MHVAEFVRILPARLRSSHEFRYFGMHVAEFVDSAPARLRNSHEFRYFGMHVAEFVRILRLRGFGTLTSSTTLECT